MNDALGYNYETVRNSIGAVQKAYDELVEVLSNHTQTRFVSKMAELWACNQAINFFNQTFKPSVEGLVNSEVNSVNAVFESVAKSMNSAAQTWALRTNTEHTPIPFATKIISIDVSGIQENIAGIRGIDKSSAEVAQNSLQVLSDDAIKALAKAESAVVGCGFLGGDQENSLISSMGMIKTNITTAYSNLSTETGNSIKETVAAYQDTAGSISSAFKGQA